MFFINEINDFVKLLDDFMILNPILQYIKYLISRIHLIPMYCKNVNDMSIDEHYNYNSVLTIFKQKIENVKFFILYFFYLKIYYYFIYYKNE